MLIRSVLSRSQTSPLPLLTVLDQPVWVLKCNSIQAWTCRYHDARVLYTNIFSFLCFRIFFAGAVNWNYETDDVD